MTEQEALDEATRAYGWDNFADAAFFYGPDCTSAPHQIAAIRAHATTIMENAALKAENERLRSAMVVMDNTVRELTEALREMFEAVCGETGFAQAVRAESGIAYPWPALDLAEAMARAALKEIEGDL